MEQTFLIEYFPSRRMLCFHVVC